MARANVQDATCPPQAKFCGRPSSQSGKEWPRLAWARVSPLLSYTHVLNR
jgi:hypothetical protein